MVFDVVNADAVFVVKKDVMEACLSCGCVAFVLASWESVSVEEGRY